MIETATPPCRPSEAGWRIRLVQAAGKVTGKPHILMLFGQLPRSYQVEAAERVRQAVPIFLAAAA
ncbi:hypothetical protein JMJ56_19860 [Belnapia sp. T18]|uniref:Uncharacterized protein n=1 Tax=Belnapia arida TaxID=2804533 RepID=A0ABS1U6K2_9PROT|nr:hypothetical protein [Belnapia arida]MBL6080278.1 hypothetical protein [Belnapia arida]